MNTSYEPSWVTEKFELAEPFTDRILIVDDEFDTISIFKQVLKAFMYWIHRSVVNNGTFSNKLKAV
jgi:hypothetical protein